MPIPKPKAKEKQKDFMNEKDISNKNSQLRKLKASVMKKWL